MSETPDVSTPKGAPSVNEPAIAAAGPAPGAGGPLLAPATTERTVRVRLVAASGEAACHFWVGLAAKGGQSPTKLMDVDEMGSLLNDAATAGISESGPVMLSDTNVTPPRYVYLLPVPEMSFRERFIWIAELVQSLAAWAPPTAGFYIAPQLLRTAEAHELLLATLTALIQASPTEEYVLLTGTYGLNALLNVALKLKADLDGDSLRLAVYH